MKITVCEKSPVRNYNREIRNFIYLVLKIHESVTRGIDDKRSFFKTKRISQGL